MHNRLEEIIGMNQVIVWEGESETSRAIGNSLVHQEFIVARYG